MKLFEIPDFHYESGEIHDGLCQRILDAQKTHEPDIIVFAGDFWNRPVMLSDKTGVNKAREFIKSLAQHSCVVMIYGTPSHEPPGSLEAFEDCGAVILRPGKYYGYCDYREVREMNPNVGYMNPDLLLFGIPEPSKKNVSDMTAAEANGTIEDALRTYVREYVAPMRAKHPDIPAFLVYHGNLSDSKKENCTDMVLKSSDILLRSEDLAVANLTRVILGHIHKPWESSIISAGYAGSWGGSWGERDFLPAFNLWDDGQITRIPYGTPIRKKIAKPQSEYDPAIAYWLETEDPNDPEPVAHPWSRKTVLPDTKITRRTEEDTSEMSLAELFKIADPNVGTDILLAAEKLEKEISQKTLHTISAEVLSVEISGCVFFSGDIALDITKCEPGITAIRGNNGEGKSSLLAFCSPYPIVIGKDTKSGRDSAIKDFFPEGGTVKKVIRMNGETHEHFMTIKSKTECYLKINGVPQLEKGTFAEMLQECEKLYGPFSDYLLTSFYVQPLQGKTGTSLMSAGMPDIRNLVQSIAGIDRENEKRFCLDQVLELGNQVEKIQTWIDASSEFNIDIEAEKQKVKELEEKAVWIAQNIEDIETAMNGEQSRLDFLIEKKEITISERARRTEAAQRAESLRYGIERQKERMKGLQQAISSLDSNRKQLEEYEAINELTIQNQRMKAEYDAQVMAFNTRKAEHDSKERMRLSNIKQLQDQRSIWEKQKANIEKPCPNCGYIPEDVKDEIANLDRIIRETIDGEAGFAFDEVPFTETPPDEPNYNVIPSSFIDAAAIKMEIEQALSAESLIEEISDNIREKSEEIARIEKEEFKIDETIEQQVDDAKQKLRETGQKLSEAAQSKRAAEYEISSIGKRIESAEEFERKIITERDRMIALEQDRETYDYMARMLQPAKIPAIEMDYFVSNIDRIATEILKEFHEGRYTIRTATQVMGKKDMVDKFDIVIHDAETGEEKSFLEFNPGHKAFFSDAYVKALVNQRNERHKRSYDPIILDESDGPIQPEKIAEYYNMQRRFWKNQNVLVVSHSPASHEHIENQINIKELKS